MDFEFFEPEEDVHITHRNLPHWEQEGATYFITFRTCDSIPAKVIQRWYRQRDDWMRRRGIDPGSKRCRQEFMGLSSSLRRAFRQEFARKFHRQLDQCHGPCVVVPK